MGFLYSQLFKSLPVPSGSYTGKTIIVTGSNSGLGKEAARHVARLGPHRLILAVRDEEKGEQAKRDIESNTTGVTLPPGTIQVWKLDMGSYESVKQFAGRVTAELDRVDAVLLNAGINPSAFKIVEQDESTVTVNVVSTFLLVCLLMPKLKAAAGRFNIRPNVTITASAVHAWPKFPQQDAGEGQIFKEITADAGRNFNSDEQYWLSKLLEVYAVRALAERHPADRLPVTVNCINPGLCQSGLFRDRGWGYAIFCALIARTCENGSRTLVHAAEQGAESHGGYLDDCELTPPAPNVTSERGKIAQDRVWGELVKKLEAIQPGVTNF
ncbi:short-chain dehydrogenase [Cladorrhinum samala]|uniref:Short-chain dehydrogenase n=1 Tax=Cladorrhinum samala TaxID=585594 RepID=A0AAV9HJM4_9PEZI|nr:short-chain dehydrogenase [Cladorrhinum samala]